MKPSLLAELVPPALCTPEELQEVPPLSPPVPLCVVVSEIIQNTASQWRHIARPWELLGCESRQNHRRSVPAFSQSVSL